MSATRRMIAHSILISIATATAVRAETIYVNGDCGNDDWTGTSSVCEAPNGPMLTIQAGIDAGVNGDTVSVADGTYTGVGKKNPDYGGRLITLRSENGAATCIIDCEDDGRGFWFHNGEIADAVLDGFTIRNGNGDAGNGGAIYCLGASPTFLDCVLDNNFAFGGSGGGMYAFNSSPQLTDCTFTRNGARAVGGGLFVNRGSPVVTDCSIVKNWVFGTFGGSGGGMAFSDSNVTMTNCMFRGNDAFYRGFEPSNGGGIIVNDVNATLTNCRFSGNGAAFGGGMYNRLSSPTLINCMFGVNTAGPDVGLGGGMYNVISSPMLINCTFSGNAADSNGGGMFNFQSSPTVTNCTFSGNSATSGGGTYSVSSNTTPMVNNCILWNNSPDEIVDASGAVTTVSFSDVQGVWPGTGNINDDPRFVDPVNGNYRLSPGSPCIDAADNTAVPMGIVTDLDGNPRFVDDPDTPDCQQLPGECGDPPIVDMGAYEFQGLCDPCDMGCDGVVNAFDIEPFLDLLFGGGEPCAPCTGDVDGNGEIDAFDIEPFLNCLFP